MSVIVAGMNMPRCCIECPIYNNEFGCCSLISDSCFYDENGEVYDPFEDRNKDCPLSEVN